MSAPLTGKRILVTGAGGGIGRATARLVAAQGASVLLTDVNGDGLKETLRLLDEDNPRVDVVAEVLDSTDEAAAIALVERIATAWGGDLDALLNIAGAILAKPLMETSLAELERLFRINVGGALVMTKAALPHLKGGAVIVNVTSTSGAHVSPGLGAYGTSKAANIYLTRALSVELAERKIRVCGVGPGAVDTGMPRTVMPPGEEGERLLTEAIEHTQLIKRMAQPEEIAKAIAFLISDDASFITGSTLWIDGGRPA
jgi:NAD(P)-dependent dehydrogenase (short-subunit alcohol dehydrogenase family)